MSTEQDKDSFSIKRTRGGDGGLESLGGPGLPLGSPDKKRRKSNAQASSFAPLSEYAPPTNPSTDHLVACNPFDDGYNSTPVSLKFHSPGFSGYGAPRTSPHIHTRMAAPYGSSYHIRNHLHSFAQNPMGTGFTRAPGFYHTQSESPAFAGQPMFNNHGGIQLPPAQNINQLHLINQTYGVDPGMTRPAVGKRSPDSVNLSPGLVHPPSSFTKTVPPKQDVSETAKNETAPRKPIPRSEEIGTQEVEFKTKNKSKEIEKMNGIIHPNSEPLKKSPHPTENSAERRRRASSNKSGSRSRLSSSTPSEPVYPCGICQVEVKDDQDAILCEASCQKWFHRLCTGMTETAYNLLTAELAAVWGCDTCMKEKDGVQLLKSAETSGPATASGEGQT